MTQERDRVSGHSNELGSGSLVTEQVKQGTQQAVQHTQEAAGQVTESAKQHAVSYAASQKQTASENLRSVSEALREAGQSLENKDQAPIGGYARRAADGVEGLAGYLERTPVQELIRDVEDFARRHSTMFLGGAFALGMAGARFIKASSPSSTRSSGGVSEAFSSSGYRDRGSYRAKTLSAGSDSSSAARLDDTGITAAQSQPGSPSTSGVEGAVELSDATVFNADLVTETSDGTTR